MAIWSDGRTVEWWTIWSDGRTVEWWTIDRGDDFFIWSDGRTVEWWTIDRGDDGYLERWSHSRVVDYLERVVAQ